VKSGGGRDSYDVEKAHQKAKNKRRFSKYLGMKVKSDDRIEKFLQEKIQLHWSPQAIAGVLYQEEGISIGKDAIYTYLYSAYGQKFCRYLYRQRYKKKKRRKKKSKHSIIKDRVFIEQRPHYINQRKRFGHYEGDTMGRPKKSSPQTLVVIRERLSRKIFVKKVSQLKNSMNGFKELLQDNTVYSLTLDNGVENARHKELNITTYFCHPYSSWQKGSVENAIGRLRKFIPKKADLKHFSHDQIQSFVDTLNNTPMKVLGYKTPNQVFDFYSNL
jgi:IS30 family transposase